MQLIAMLPQRDLQKIFWKLSKNKHELLNEADDGICNEWENT